MDHEEAQRRFERLLLLSEYQTYSSEYTGRWDKDREVFSLDIVGVQGLKGTLYKELNEWIAEITFDVGESGRFPLAGGKIIRAPGQMWKLPKYSTLYQRILQIKSQVSRWDREGFNQFSGPIAILHLVLFYIRRDQPKKAKSIILGTIRGELWAGTISEALSIVQSKWCKSREERLQSALIWASNFP